MGCGFGKPAVGVSKPASAPQSTLHLVTAAPNPAPAPPPASYAPQKSVDAGGGAATVRTSDGLNGSGKNSAATATSTTTSSGPLMPTQSYDQQFSKAHVVSTDTLTVPSKPPSEPESTPASAGTAAVAVQPRAPASSASASYAHHAQLVQKGVYGVPSQPLSQYTPMPGGVRWRKGEMIGRGAVGAVYLGLNDDTGSLMAVKELQYRADSQKEVEGLMREINVMRYVCYLCLAVTCPRGDYKCLCLQLTGAREHCAIPGHRGVGHCPVHLHGVGSRRLHPQSTGEIHQAQGKGGQELHAADPRWLGIPAREPRHT